MTFGEVPVGAKFRAAYGTKTLVRRVYTKIKSTLYKADSEKMTVNAYRKYLLNGMKATAYVRFHDTDEVELLD